MKARVLAILAAAMLLATPAHAGTSGPSIAEGRGLRLLGWTPLPYAYDMATTHAGGRTLAVAINLPPGSQTTELKVVDVTAASRPRVRAVLPCDGILRDVAATSDPGVVAVMLWGEPDCLGSKGHALVLVDVSAPGRPTVTGRTELQAPRGLPNPRNPWPWPTPSVGGHPNAPYLYTTRNVDGQGELVAWRIGGSSGIEMASALPLPGEPRDLDVKDDGSMLAVGLGQTFATIDLTDPATPELSSVTHCPGCFLVSQVEFAGRLGLVVSDESPNTIGCPSGPLFFYTIELGTPVLYSVYNPSTLEPDPHEQPLPRVCQTDDLDVSPNGRLALLTWHRNSVRMLYIGSAFGAGAAATGYDSGRIFEVGWFRLDATWASAARFLGDSHLITLDQNWGFNTLTLEPCAYRFAC